MTEEIRIKRPIEITCLNTNTVKKYKLGKSLRYISKDLGVQLKYPVIGARVNNKVEELRYKIYKPKTVEFIDITDIDGYRMYQRSLSFVLMKAVRELFPYAILKIEHSISKGFYCEVEGLEDKLSVENVLAIGERMREIVAKNIPFKREEIKNEEAVKLFEQNRYFEKVRLFKNRKIFYTSIYKLEDQIDYFYGYLVPSTGYLFNFDLVPYFDGMLLMFPSRDNPEELEENTPQDKLFEIFQEYKDWAKVLQVETVGQINEEVRKGRCSELIQVSEALHEKKVSNIADKIFENRNNIRLILISGPSSSGKTTFSKRLAVQLKVLGIKSFAISLDDYFVDRENTPKDEKGEYNFEVIEALDVKTFNENLIQLFEGNEVELPKFSFQTGKRFYTGEKTRLEYGTVVIAEGIHGLNPKLSAMIPAKKKFKIYVSALTQMGIDLHNRIPTTDNRLLRRIIRDHQYRGYSALETIKRWPSVRHGEDKYIFPFQEEADVMFNSALLFELGVLKRYAEPLLKQISEIEHQHSEAHRLLKFLSYFEPIPDEEIPPTSILREFLSGSSFKY